MIFNSLTFIVFFLVVLALHYAPFSWRTKRINLLIASYFFYGAWNPPFLILLWVSTIVDFFAARRMSATNNPIVRKLCMLASLTTNLGLLGYFKYGTFILNNFVALVNSLGLHYHPATPDIVLPVGISFYSFHTLSYTIDVYRKQLKSDWSFLNFALYVTFFPQLVAGPIMRAVDFLPQLLKPVRATTAEMGWGLSLIAIGLFEKVVLGDTLMAPVADHVYSASASAGFLSSWIGTFAFSGQIFFDFAGYSTCAIGAAMCLGFSLIKNFHYPYAAIGFSDFWRRWHISLSTWLRNYLYIPLGGNKISTERTYANLMLTMLIGGLWHGAAWRFIVWGGLHGSYLVAERLLKTYAKQRSKLVPVTGNEPSPEVVRAPVGGREEGYIRISLPAFQWFVNAMAAFSTYLLVCVTWVFFRATDLGSATNLIRAMFGKTIEQIHIGKDELIVLVLTFLMLCSHFALRNSDLDSVARRMPWWIRSVVLAGILVLLAFYLTRGEERAFIYFQF